MRLLQPGALHFGQHMCGHLSTRHIHVRTFMEVFTFPGFFTWKSKISFKKKSNPLSWYHPAEF